MQGGEGGGPSSSDGTSKDGSSGANQRSSGRAKSKRDSKSDISDYRDSADTELCQS